MEEPRIAEPLTMTQLAQAALVGIGTTNAHATLVQSGYVTPGRLLLFQRRGAAGDVLGRFFNGEGGELNIELHRQVIGVSLRELHRIPLRIGATGGVQKISGLPGAISGGHVNVLITDEDMDGRLLRERM